MPNFPRQRINLSRQSIELTPEQQDADFRLFEEFYRDQPPERRFFATSIPAFDEALGGAGIPSGVLTSWRARHTFATDALLLETCRAACARGERVHLVDAADRFGPERLRIAGLQGFAEQELFERTVINTIPALAPRVDAWRKGAIENAPDLLVVDSLVATIATAIVASANTGDSNPSRLPGAQRQSEMFERLLAKMRGLTFWHASAILVVEPPITGKPTNQSRQKKGNRGRQKQRRSNESLEFIARRLLGEVSRVRLSLGQPTKESSLVRVNVECNGFARTSGSALIDVRGDR